MFSQLHQDEVEDLLFSHHLGHLACIADGAPYVVPITYVYHAGMLYGLTRPGRKVFAMRENPTVSLGIVDVGDPRRWRSVIVDGTYNEVVDQQERDEALALLQDISPHGTAIAGAILFRIHPTHRSGRAIDTTG